MSYGYPRLVSLTIVGPYTAGDPAPDGYLQWHEWARVQHKAGLRQKRCQICLRLSYPQEIGPNGECLKCKHKSPLK